MIAAAIRRLQADRDLRTALVRLLVAIVAVQAAYWLAVRPLLERPALPDTLFEITSFDSERIASPDRRGIAAGAFRPAGMMMTGCCEPAHYAVRFTFDVDRSAPDGLGITPSVLADNARVFVNGHLLVNEGRIDLPRPTVERLRSLWFVPPELVKPGRNTLEIVTVRATMPYTDVSKPRIGPWPEMKRAFAAREFLFEQYGWISIAICLVIAIAAFVIFLRGGRNPAWLWLAVLTGAWALRIFLPFWSEFPLAGNGRTLVWSATTTTVALAWAMFANEWGRKPILRLRRALLPLAVVKLVVNAALLEGQPVPAGYDNSVLVDLWSGLAFSAVAVFLLLRNALLFGRRHSVETALFLLLAMLIVQEALGALQINTYADGLAFTAPLIFVALAASFLSRNVRLFRSMEEYNERLSAELAEREREIASVYAERQEVSRQQALLDERKRIMRDMHDGIGGRLISIAAELRGRSKIARPDMIAGELMEALDEVRLIVDSLDTAGDGLGMALGAFRARTEPKLAATGIESEWSVEEAAAERSLSPTAILHIYRIMQEVCANMLRHSGADRFEVRLRTNADGAVVLEMSDNGKGLAGDQPRGQGLSSIEARAAQLGGTIAFASDAAGLKVSLVLPPDEPSTTPVQ